MNVYDFDDTIYYGNSERDFYLYLLKKNPFIFIYIFKYLFFVLFVLKNKKDITLRRQKFYEYLKIYNKASYKIKLKNIHYSNANDFNDLDSLNIKLIDNFFYKKIKIMIVDNFNIIDLYVLDFWIDKEKNIKKWYLDIKNDNDLIISATQDFILKPICEKLKLNLISTEYDLLNFKYKTPICKGIEKVKRYNALYSDKVDNFYSDSLSDEPMMKFAKNGFIVKKDKIVPYNSNNYK